MPLTLTPASHGSLTLGIPPNLTEDHLLQEGSGFIALENGSGFILLESSASGLTLTPVTTGSLSLTPDPAT